MQFDSFNESRRQFIQTSLLAGLTGLLPQWVSAQGDLTAKTVDQPLFMFLHLRGGMDGLDVVRPVFDPGYEVLRGRLGEKAMSGAELGNSGFRFNPVMANAPALFQSGELAVLHAVGSAYTERSHFDAQQVVESAGSRPYELSTGFMGRTLAGISGRGLALGSSVPLVLKGASNSSVENWAPATNQTGPDDELIARLQRIYATDATVLDALRQANETSLSASQLDLDQKRNQLSSMASVVKLGLASGARMIAMDLGGWDSHANQWQPNSQFARTLQTLDESFLTLKNACGARWKNTVVMVVSEFGRTASVNGTLGTDHGTGNAAFLLGGRVKGGKVFADWPGLSQSQLNEGRDLKITTDLRQLQAGVLGRLFGLSATQLDKPFPGVSVARGKGVSIAEQLLKSTS